MTKRKNTIAYIVLAIVILASLGRITYLFAFEKEGVHSDEVWSYGLANGYREPYIFTNYDQNEDKYAYEWIKGQTLNDYLTVQKGEGFDYGSVLYNLKSDNHPPLYFFVLHTICSFFPDEFSLWYGYIINIAVYIVLAIYLYLLVRKLTGEPWIGILTVAAYGFTTMGVDTFLFVRHYAMVAMFIVMTIYHTMKLLEASEKKVFIKRLIGLLIIMTCGCLTHYEYVPFLAVFGILVLVRYIVKKEYAKMWWYGGACAVSAVVLMLSTGIITRLLMRVNNTEFDGTKAEDSMVQDGATFFEDVISNVKLTIYDITGINLTDAGAIGVLIGLAVLVVLLIVGTVVVLKLKKAGKIKLFGDKKPGITGFVVLATALATLGFMIFVTATCSQKNMGDYANRYLFPVYPLFTLFIVCGAWVVTKNAYKLIESKLRSAETDEAHSPAKRNLTINIIVSVIIAIYVVVNIAHAEMIYLFPRGNEKPRMEDYTKGKDVALFLSDHWLITTYTDLLREADDIYIAHSDTYEGIKQADLSDHKVDYIVFDATWFYYGTKYEAHATEADKRAKNESYFMNTLKKSLGVKDLKYIQSDWVFTRRVYIYEAEW